MSNKRTISLITEGGTTEVQWSDQEPVAGEVEGYVQIHEDGTLTVPFRNSEDDAFVFVLNAERAEIYATEDQPPGDDAEIVWSAEG